MSLDSGLILLAAFILFLAGGGYWGYRRSLLHLDHQIQGIAQHIQRAEALLKEAEETYAQQVAHSHQMDLQIAQEKETFQQELKEREAAHEAELHQLKLQREEMAKRQRERLEAVILSKARSFLIQSVVTETKKRLQSQLSPEEQKQIHRASLDKLMKIPRER